MAKDISPRAEVHKNAVIGENTTIMPFAVIDENVKIGDGTTIGAHCHITGWTDLGKNNIVHSGAIIGREPQDSGYKNEKSFVNIGDNNVFREGMTVHRGTQENSQTIIGSSNLFMVYSHVGHNCIVHDHIIMVNNSALAGYVEVFDRVFISHASAAHQFTRIGRYAMIAPLSKVGKDIPPFMLASGSRTASVHTLNVVGLRRADISVEDRKIIKAAYKVLYHSGWNTTQALEKLSEDKELNSHSLIQEMMQFIRAAKRGIAAHCRGNSSKDEE
jgi:UDP-N-acetylglucosamine acyltransferase